MKHVLCLLIVVLFATPATAEPNAHPGLDTLFTDADGNQLTLRDDFAGKVVVLNFWATWCAPCVEEMPGLDFLQQTYQEKGLEVVAVSQDFGGLKIVKRFFERTQLAHLPIYLDIKNQLFGQFGEGSLPLTLILDRSGKIVFSHSGYLDWKSVKNQAIIAEVLAKKRS